MCIRTNDGKITKERWINMPSTNWIVMRHPWNSSGRKKLQLKPALVATALRDSYSHDLFRLPGEKMPNGMRNSVVRLAFQSHSLKSIGLIDICLENVSINTVWTVVFWWIMAFTNRIKPRLLHRSKIWTKQFSCGQLYNQFFVVWFLVNSRLSVSTGLRCVFRALKSCTNTIETTGRRNREANREKNEIITIMCISDLVVTWRYMA